MLFLPNHVPPLPTMSRRTAGLTTFQYILLRPLVQTEAGDQALKLDVFLPELLQPLDLHLAHPGKPVLPLVERHLRHGQLAADVLHRHAALRVPQGECNLLIRVSSPLQPVRSHQADIGLERTIRPELSTILS